MEQSKLRARIFVASLAPWLVSLTISAVPFRAAAEQGTSTGWGWAWGFNGNGQLGSGTSTGSDVPASTGLGSATKVAGGAWHSLALTKNGTSTVWAWGDNSFDQLGNFSTSTQSDVPVEVHSTWSPGYGEPVDIAAGGEHSLALTSNGSSTYVWAWGYNRFGQLGNGSTVDSPVPTPVLAHGDGLFPPGTSVAIAIAAGESHSLALTQNSTSTVVWAWGNNGYGQLGDGTTVDKWNPEQVNVPVDPGERVTAIAAGGNHSLALTSNGKVYAWGWNLFGQLGDGTTTTRTSPTAVAGPIGSWTVKAIAGGGAHSLALDSNGKVYAWGWNVDGQLGDGTTADRSSATAINGPTEGWIAKAIAGGGAHSLALDSSGKVFAWGWNSYGQLGDGTTTTRTSPTAAMSPTGIWVGKAISGGWLQSLAVLEPVSPCETATVTVLSQSSTTFGNAVTDTATVNNAPGCFLGDPTGTVTFYYRTPRSSSWLPLGSAKALSGGSAISDSYPPPAADTDPYYFKGVYSGDANHSGSTSGEDAEPLMVNKAPTSVKTVLSKSTIRLHEAVTDTVTVSASVAGTAGGTWTVEASRSSGFSSPVLLAGPNAVLHLPLTMAPSFTLPSSGLWYVRGYYSGDGNYTGSYSGDLEEVLYVLPY